MLPELQTRCVPKAVRLLFVPNLASADLEKISRGLELDDGFIRPDNIQYVENADRKQVGM